MKLGKVYMVSIPSHADYSEWWYIVGLFSTKEKAKQFINKHPIMRYEQRNGSMKPVTKYDRLKAIEIDKAPLLGRREAQDYFGKDVYRSKEEKAQDRRRDAKIAKITRYDEMMERLNAHIWIESRRTKEDLKWLRWLRAELKEQIGNNKAGQSPSEPKNVI